VDQQFRISTMDLEQPAPEFKTSAPGRTRLPNRRACETTAFEHGGASFTMTAGRYEDGRIGEAFINAGHANSALDFLISDAAILLSIALQFGADPGELRHAMKRFGDGSPASPIGAALDRIAP
jgi:hypothetical protein